MFGPIISAASARPRCVPPPHSVNYVGGDRCEHYEVRLGGRAAREGRGPAASDKHGGHRDEGLARSNVPPRK